MDIKQNTKTLPTSLVEWLKDLLENNKFCSPTAEDFLQPLKIAEKVAGSIQESGLLTKENTINSNGLKLYLSESLPCMEVDDLCQLYDDPRRFFCHVGTNRSQSFVAFIGKNEKTFSVSKILKKNAGLIEYFKEQTDKQSIFAIDLEIDYDLIVEGYEAVRHETEDCGMPIEELFSNGDY